MQTENVAFWFDGDRDEDCPLIVSCKDREFTGERWVFASLSPKEVKQLFELLKEHL